MDKKYFNEHLEIALSNFITQSICQFHRTDKEKLDFINLYLSSNLPIPDGIKEHITTCNNTTINLLVLFNQEKRNNKLENLGI